MKEQLIEKVREFREAFGLKQDDLKLHKSLFAEEHNEYILADEEFERVDALADMLFVSAGAVLDGFKELDEEIDYTIMLSEIDEIDLPRAVDAVFASNMSKLCTEDQLVATKAKYAFIGVPVTFEKIEDRDDYRCVCAHTVTGDDGKEYPAGKLLKSVGYVEPDWSYLDA